MNSSLSKDIARVVRGILAEREINGVQFAETIGHPNSTVNRWLKGGAISSDAIEDIAAGLGWDPVELIRTAIRTRPQGDDPGGLGAAIDRIRPDRGGNPTKRTRSETGT